MLTWGCFNSKFDHILKSVCLLENLFWNFIKMRNRDWLGIKSPRFYSIRLELRATWNYLVPILPASLRIMFAENPYGERLSGFRPFRVKLIRRTWSQSVGAVGTNQERWKIPLKERLSGPLRATNIVFIRVYFSSWSSNYIYYEFSSSILFVLNNVAEQWSIAVVESEGCDTHPRNHNLIIGCVMINSFLLGYSAFVGIAYLGNNSVKWTAIWLKCP